MPAFRKKSGFGQSAETSFGFVGVLVLLEAADTLLQHFRGVTLDGLGILPREPTGLIGVVMAPLLHGGWPHLFANAIPLLVLLTLLFWDRRYRASSTLVFIWVASGVGTWVIGRAHVVHIGASMLIFGLVSYLIVGGIRLGTWRTAITAFLVALAFGGIFYGVLPGDPTISWEGHLCGALAGIIAGFRCHR